MLGGATGDEKGWREKGKRGREKAGREEIEGKGKVTRSKNLGKQGVKGTMANSVKLTGRKKEIGFLRKVMCVMCTSAKRYGSLLFLHLSIDSDIMSKHYYY